MSVQHLDNPSVTLVHGGDFEKETHKTSVRSAGVLRAIDRRRERTRPTQPRPPPSPVPAPVRISRSLPPCSLPAYSSLLIGFTPLSSKENQLVQDEISAPALDHRLLCGDRRIKVRFLPFTLFFILSELVFIRRCENWCNQRGQCTSSGPDGECLCDMGYTGDDCGLRKDPCISLN